MIDSFKEDSYSQLMWDYNIPSEKIDKLLSGEIEFAGHYNRESLFKKMLESFPWFTVVQLVGIRTIREILTEEVIEKLRTPALRSKYTYVRKRLQEIIPVSG